MSIQPPGIGLKCPVFRPGNILRGITLVTTLACSAWGQERLAVFPAAGPGGPDPQVLSDVDAALRRALLPALPPDRWVTLMADAAAPGCTGRCAVDRAAEYGASLALAVRVDLTTTPVELDLDVYAAPAGAILAQRRAEAGSATGMLDLLPRVVAELVAALSGEAPARRHDPITDPQAEARHAAARRQAIAEASGQNTVGMDMLLVEPGQPFLEAPAGQHYVQARPLPAPRQAFLLAATEVTQAQWRAVMGNNPSAFVHDQRPVEQVTWLDAVEFCNRLSEREGLTPVYIVTGGSARRREGADGYRLPTDAQWEYACRAGSLTMFSAGARPRDLERIAWFADNAGGRTREVAGRRANAWGFHDLHGNVWEWVEDAYADLPDLSPGNIESPGIGPDRTIRGGSWYTDAMACRTTNFCRIDPGFRCNDLGFRVARTP